MSLHPHAIAAIPKETIRVAHAVLPQGNVWMQMRDELGTLYEDQDFADLFPSRGQPAEAPWRLALVTVMQYGEGLTDRQAADAVRTRIDWKYVLSLELTDIGFDFSVLSEFRGRLLAHQELQAGVDLLRILRRLLVRRLAIFGNCLVREPGGEFIIGERRIMREVEA